MPVEARGAERGVRGGGEGGQAMPVDRVAMTG
jgi:hypothetical protein